MRIALGALIVAALPAVVLAQSPVFPPGSRTGLVPPTGFELASGFVGFEKPAEGSAIVVGDLPEPTFDEMLPTFTPRGMAPGGIKTNEAAVPWLVAGGEGRLLRGQQTSRGVTYRRWIVLARGAGTATVVSAMVPESRADAATPAVEAALRTIAFRSPPRLDEQIAALPFRVGDRAGFRPILAQGGLSLLLTEGPHDQPRAAQQPIVYVLLHQSGANGGPDDNLDLARRLFGSTPTLKSIAPTHSEDRGGGAESFIEGHAVENGTEASVEVVQIMRFEAGGYVRVVGIWRAHSDGSLRERVERLAASVARK